MIIIITAYSDVCLVGLVNNWVQIRLRGNNLLLLLLRIGLRSWLHVLRHDGNGLLHHWVSHWDIRHVHVHVLHRHGNISELLLGNWILLLWCFRSSWSLSLNSSWGLSLNGCQRNVGLGCTTFGGLLSFPHPRATRCCEERAISIVLDQCNQHSGVSQTNSLEHNKEEYQEVRPPSAVLAIDKHTNQGNEREDVHDQRIHKVSC